MLLFIILIRQGVPGKLLMDGHLGRQKMGSYLLISGIDI
jgi:hypothetical protein